MSSKILIVAPHIDDELIGCWSVLNRTDTDLHVLYLYEITSTRKSEALAVAFKFNFTAHFLEGAIPLAEFSTFDEFYVPSRRDWHADHKKVNSIYRHWATHFYSVDMGKGVLLKQSHLKRSYLNDCYPSQRTLWEANDKYWLFEDIQECDYDEYQTLSWTQPGGNNFKVTVLQEHHNAVNKWYYSYVDCRAIQFMKNRRACVNDLLAVCSGKVKIEYLSITVEA